jgi:hypothetical protein
MLAKYQQIESDGIGSIGSATCIFRPLYFIGDSSRSTLLASPLGRELVRISKRPEDSLESSLRLGVVSKETADDTRGKRPAE